MHPIRHKWIAALTLVCFLAGEFYRCAPALANPSVFSSTEVAVPSGFNLHIPPDFGTVEAVHSLPPGRQAAPVIIHIQEAHGNAEAQKKIADILHHLKSQYGIDQILLEGNAFPLKPELLKFFPDNPKLNTEILEKLAEKSLATGPELFLAQEKSAGASGIEDIGAYVKNGRAFVEVLKAREKSSQFLRDLDLQIHRFAGAYLNQDLARFLKAQESFESKLVSFAGHLEFLKKQAREVLKVNLGDPREQIGWPMLLRMFTLERMEKRLDLAAFEKEREAFIKALHGAWGIGHRAEKDSNRDSMRYAQYSAQSSRTFGSRSRDSFRSHGQSSAPEF